MKDNPKIQSSWNLGLLFTSDTDPEIEKQRVQVEKAIRIFAETWKNRSDYLEDPGVLRNALDQYEELIRLYGQSGKEGYYFWLRSMLDQTNTGIKAKNTLVNDFGTKNVNTIQFFSINLSKIPESKQQRFLEYPELLPYRHYLEKMFVRGKHVLSDAEERILNLTEVTSYERWISMVSDFLSREEREVLTAEGVTEVKNFTEISSLINDSNKSVRDTAAQALNEILLKHTDTAEAEMNSVLEYKKTNDLLRGYARPDSSRHISDDIDSKTVDTLVGTVSARNGISQRFYTLKAKMLGTDVLAYHERNVEIGTFDLSYPFDKSVSLVKDVFTQLDPEFADIFTRFLRDGQIDVYPKQGKRGGAFCSYWLISLPTFVLLNHTDRLTDVRTLAHEMGHGINNELMKKKQNSLNFGTPMATAEVASTFMEDFVLEHIMGSVSDEARLTLMMSKLNADISSIFRQIALYRFEQELHLLYRQKGYLSHKEIGSLFQRHMAEYMGPAVEQSPGSENWWIHWWHIRSYFYVYSYASGLLISKAMQNAVRENHEFIGKVKEFLSTGLSASPKDIFARMDIDITSDSFWNRGLDEIESLLDQTETLARKLGKL